MEKNKLKPVTEIIKSSYDGLQLEFKRLEV